LSCTPSVGKKRREKGGERKGSAACGRIKRIFDLTKRKVKGKGGYQRGAAKKKPLKKKVRWKSKDIGSWKERTETEIVLDTI